MIGETDRQTETGGGGGGTVERPPLPTPDIRLDERYRQTDTETGKQAGRQADRQREKEW